MTPWYIDPTISDALESDSFVGEYGTGKLRNSWADVTWAADNGYFQRADSTYAGKITVSTGGGSASARVTVGMYGTGAKPKINGAGQDRCVQVSPSSDWVDVQDFECFGPDTGTNIRCLTIGSTQSNISTNCRVRRCVLHDCVSNGIDTNGISAFGNDLTIEDCDIYNIPTDGIWLQGNRATIRNNRIRNVALDGRAAGDCLQISSDGTLSSSNFVVTDNMLDHSNIHCKQVFIHSGTGSVGGLFARNICIMPPWDGVIFTSVCFVQSDGALIAGNYFQGGHYGLFCETGTRITAVGNVAVGGQRGLQLSSSANPGTKLYHNTIIDAVVYGIYCGLNSASDEVKNNILLRCGTGVAKWGPVVEDYNDYYGCTTDQLNLGGTPSWGSNKFAIDPQLDSAYRPTNATLRGAGSYLGGLDFYGKDFKVPPTLGAIEYFAQRALITRRLSGGRTTVSRRPRPRVALRT